MAVDDRASAADDDRCGRSATPWTFCVDWGHGTILPLYGQQADTMEPWLAELQDVISAVHIQQTDFILDRHGTSLKRDV